MEYPIDMTASFRREQRAKLRQREAAKIWKQLLAVVWHTIALSLAVAAWTHIGPKWSTAFTIGAATAYALAALFSTIFRHF